MPVFAAIDIGSNSCRLAIASVSQHKLKTLHEDREVTRLGESVFQTGMISPDAMAGTIKALKRFHKAVQAARLRQGSRRRHQRHARRAQLRSLPSPGSGVSTGWTVEIISGLEEGRLIHLGVVTHEPGAQGQGAC